MGDLIKKSHGECRCVSVPVQYLPLLSAARALVDKRGSFKGSYRPPRPAHTPPISTTYPQLYAGRILFSILNDSFYFIGLWKICMLDAYYLFKKIHLI